MPSSTTDAFLPLDATGGALHKTLKWQSRSEPEDPHEAEGCRGVRGRIRFLPKSPAHPLPPNIHPDLVSQGKYICLPEAESRCGRGRGKKLVEEGDL